jgi:multiple sugar transport system permease protein
MRRLSPYLVGMAVAAMLTWSLAPALWQVITSVKTDDQITRVPTVYVPDPMTSAHYEALFRRKPFATYLLNSVVVAAGATALCIGVGLPAAAALVRLSPRRRDAALLALLALALFPPILLLFPLYEGVRYLGLVNHPLALILPYAAFNLPLAVWVLESGLRGIPRALDEAAILDGLGPLERIRRVHAPLAAPSVVTAAVLAFIFSWNEFLLALTFATREEAKVVTAGIASVSGSSLYEIPWGPLTAAVVVATAPLVVLVLAFEKKIASGLTRGALKG